MRPADVEPLLDVLDRLRRAGNSLFVVERDMDVVRRADWIVDVGPGPGELGQGSALQRPGTRSGQRIGVGHSQVPVRRCRAAVRSIRRAVRAAAAAGNLLHNLRDLDVDLPLGVYTAVTGVSGSGRKSTLVVKVIGDVVNSHLGTGRAPEPAESDDDETDAEIIDLDHDASVGVTAEGGEEINRLVSVDQRPIGRTPRSTLATYTGLFDAVRDRRDPRRGVRRGWTPGRFSFNVAEGRSHLSGEGFVSVELLFLPGTYATCPTCQGARYSGETLEVRYRDRTIADVLAMTVDQALEFLADITRGAEPDHAARGGLRISATRTARNRAVGSRGPADRAGLRTAAAPAGHTLYVLDEPTPGLHPADVDLLDSQLHRLVDAGHTVVVAEHDMRIVAGAGDWMIDLDLAPITTAVGSCGRPTD